MKKLITVALALMMVLCLGTTAFAAESTTIGTGDKKIDVTAKYSDTSSTPTVYSVDLSWDSMTFTYSKSGTKTWNPADHTYSGGGSADWDKASADVKATNHSNAQVTVSFQYEAKGDTGVTGSMSKDSFTLAAGVENKPNEAASDTSTLSISGTPNGTVTAEGITVGTITVTIA